MDPPRTLFDWNVRWLVAIQNELQDPNEQGMRIDIDSFVKFKQLK